MLKIKVLCGILFNLMMSSAREQWIDPHDMAPKLPNIASQNANRNLVHSTPSETTKCSCINNADGTLYVHYRRTLNILLNILQADQADRQYKGVLSINMPVEDYDFLKNVVQSSAEDVTQLRRVNSILDNVLSRTVFQKTSDSFTAWLQWFYFTFYSHTTAIAIAGVFISWASFKLLRANWTTWRVVKTLVLFAWVMDFAFTWIHLLQEEEIDKVTDSLKYGSIPAACDPNKMSWWQYALSIFGGRNECREYHKTMLQNVFWKVSPFTVFAHQFGIVIATPANNIGKAVGSLVSGMLSPLPFGVNYILLPILLLFFMIATCILLSFVTNTSFQINLLHMISLKIGDKQRHMIGNLLSIPVEMQQEAIESVRSQLPKQKQVKEKQNCSDVQAIDNVVRVEDVSKESDVELNEEEDRVNKEPSVSASTVVETTEVEEISVSEIRHRISKKEKKDIEGSTVKESCDQKSVPLGLFN